MLQLESITSQIEKACNLNLNTILMGDFNLGIKDPYKYNLIKTIELLFQFKQLISEPTRVSNKSPPQNQKVVSGRSYVTITFLESAVQGAPVCEISEICHSFKCLKTGSKFGLYLNC